MIRYARRSSSSRLLGITAAVRRTYLWKHCAQHYRTLEHPQHSWLASANNHQINTVPEHHMSRTAVLTNDGIASWYVQYRNNVITATRPVESAYSHKKKETSTILPDEDCKKPKIKLAASTSHATAKPASQKKRTE